MKLKVTKLSVIFLMFTAFGCSKSTVRPNTASIDIVAYQTDTLRGDDSTIAHLVDASIAVWKENTAGEIIIKNPTDGGNGIGFNSITNKEVKADFYVKSADSLMVKDIDPGLYLIYVVDHYKYDIAFPYSFKEIEIKGSVRLPKVFHYTGRNTLDPW